MDRVIQQAIAQVLIPVFDRGFSEYSYGFGPKCSQHMAINQTLEYLNEGYEWCIDMDIEKYFDTENNDRSISILREKVIATPNIIFNVNRSDRSVFYVLLVLISPRY